MRRGGVLILIIGVILIVLVGIGLFLFVSQPGGGGLAGTSGGPTVNALPTEPPEVEIVRARVDIPANTVISDSLTLLEVVSVPQTEFNAKQHFSTTSEIQGKLTLRAFQAGDVIVKSALTEPGLSQQIPTAEPNRPRDKAYPFTVNNTSGVADQIKVGDFVDVIATFEVPRPLSQINDRQTTVDATGATTQQSTRNTITEYKVYSTKTLVQRVQVLQVLKPTVASEATPQPEGGAAGEPQVDEQGRLIPPDAATQSTNGTISPGTWMVTLAMDDQESELIEFANASKARVVLVLRGAGDSAFEPTIGATLDLLIDEFGLPLPQPLPPYVLSVDMQQTPQPTRTPAPTRVP